MPPRQHRHDQSGAEFHVTNRGSARRTIFDTRREYRRFMACLALAVRRGEIEILAFTLMRTHFHLYVRSLGGLSAALHRIQSANSRLFNVSHRRDGPLVRGRFWSKQVTSETYRRNLIRYIEENPVLAGMCAAPIDHEYGSALLFSRQRVPRWLSNQYRGLSSATIGQGRATRSRADMQARAEFIEGQLRCAETDCDFPFADPTPKRVADWMVRKAALADGHFHRPPVAGPTAVRRAVRAMVPSGELTKVPGGYRHPSRDLLMAGLLREIAGCSFEAIGRLMDTTDKRVRRLRGHHGRCLEGVEGYRELAAAVVRRAIEPTL
jgi:REP element-mobilizing transposase RayT